MNTSPPIDPKVRAATIRRANVRLLIFVFLAAIIPALVWLQGWLGRTSFQALTALKPDGVSRVTVSLSDIGKPQSIVRSFDARNDGKAIGDLLSALHSSAEEGYGYRDLRSRTLLTVVYLADGRTMELQIFMNTSCSQLAYFQITQHIGRNVYVGLGEGLSEVDLSRWLRANQLSQYLGCP